MRAVKWLLPSLAYGQFCGQVLDDVIVNQCSLCTKV